MERETRESVRITRNAGIVRGFYEQRRYMTIEPCSAAYPVMIQLVWFKRDLRLHDHGPLAEAARRGPLLPLYIVEPSLVRAPDFAPQHWTFISASLAELREQLAELGQPLLVRMGEAVEVLDTLRQLLPIAAVWAHQETTNGLSYQRDRAVRRWAKGEGVPFHELPQQGVVRRLPSRDNWDEAWERHMAQPLARPPAALQPVAAVAPGPIPSHADLGLAAEDDSLRQPGGAAAAQRTLDSFLARRGLGYQHAMSSPETAWRGCSRLSPHLAWGTISIRQVLRATRARAEGLDLHGGPNEYAWRRALAAFESRLHWHCHFIQKLEDEPQIEFRNLLRAYDGLRDETSCDAERLAAWAEGRTGYPFVDACMRALTTTGWLNFRMRAMLISFACFDLWLHWRKPSLVLARRFLDYEPGIHYSQVQMQAGTSGNSTVRFYNPIKQGQDHDPDGAFIRRWLPELEGVPSGYIHQPWLMPRSLQDSSGCRIGTTYPTPIVDHELATRAARARIGAVRQRPSYAEEVAQVRQRHGSRRPPPQRPPRVAVPTAQLRFDLEQE